MLFVCAVYTAGAWTAAQNMYFLLPNLMKREQNPNRGIAQMSQIKQG